MKITVKQDKIYDILAFTVWQIDNHNDAAVLCYVINNSDDGRMWMTHKHSVILQSQLNISAANLWQSFKRLKKSKAIKKDKGLISLDPVAVRMKNITNLSLSVEFN